MASVLNAAAPLRVPVYRRLWVAQTASGLGTAMSEMALVFVVSRLTGNAAEVGFVIFALLLPPAVLGPWTGPLADRMRPHTLLVTADVWRAVMVAGMIGATLDRSASALLALVVLEGVGTAFFSPARASLVTKVVPRDILPAAMGLSQSTAAVVAVAGPAVGGVLVAAIGPLSAFAIDGVSFLVSAALVLTVPHVEPVVRKTMSYRALLGEGVATVRRSRQLGGLIGYLGLLSLGLGALNATSPSLVLITFHANARQFGALEAAQGIGGAVGPLAAAAMARMLGAGGLVSWVTLALGALLAAVPHLLQLPAVVSSIPRSAWLYPWMALVGGFVGLLTVTVQTRLLTSAPPQMIGRVAALTQAGANLGNMAGIVGASILVPSVGIPVVLEGAGLLLVVTAVAVWMATAIQRLAIPRPRGRLFFLGRTLRLSGTAGLPVPEMVVQSSLEAQAILDERELAAAAWTERQQAAERSRPASGREGSGRHIEIPKETLTPEVVNRLIASTITPGVALLNAAGARARVAASSGAPGGSAGAPAVGLYSEVMAVTEEEWRQVVSTLTETLRAERRQAVHHRVDDPESLGLYVVTLLTFHQGGETSGGWADEPQADSVSPREIAPAEVDSR